MEIEQRKDLKIGGEVRRGTIEGVVLVNGRPQIERADMPLGFSFDSIEDLERFCKTAKDRGQK